MLWSPPPGIFFKNDIQYILAVHLSGFQTGPHDMLSSHMTVYCHVTQYITWPSQILASSQEFPPGRCLTMAVTDSQVGFVSGDFALRPVLFYGGCSFTIMRCMSFALENCEKKEGHYSILEMLKYNFYLPFFYFGPIMTFDKFYIQVRSLSAVHSIRPFKEERKMKMILLKNGFLLRYWLSVYFLKNVLFFFIEIHKELIVLLYYLTHKQAELLLQARFM